MVLPVNETTDPDDELVGAARSAPEGDFRAFEQLIQLHRRRILADCRYLTRDMNNSEDLAQEVFVKAYFAMRGFEGRSSFRHWLQRIKVHHCLNHLKKRDGKESIAVDEESVQNQEALQVPPVAGAQLEANEERRRIHEVLASMPDTLRVPLVMCDMDELSYEEIATSLGIGLSAVKMRIKRAREYFRAHYQGDPPTGGPAA
jgi:RNA polymerase sigma-70 factor (ECF subfamily)